MKPANIESKWQKSDDVVEEGNLFTEFLKCLTFFVSMLDRLASKLAHRASKFSKRSIDPPLCVLGHVDFASNDYLGISRDLQFANIVHQAELQSRTTKKVLTYQGSSGSRLLSGNSELFLDVEREIASFHNQRYCLLANSGWDLNFGLLSAISSMNTAIIYDELCHNSIITGIKMATKHTASRFRHNSLADLEVLLQKHYDQEVLVVCESVYSMDGDQAPIDRILKLVSKYKNAFVIVDEAHSVGVIGTKGEGLVASLGLSSHPQLLAAVYTYGKAMGVHGAAVASSHDVLVPYLVNYCSPIIYSTALSVPSVLAIRESYRYCATLSHRRAKLSTLVNYFRHKLSLSSVGLSTLVSKSSIQGILFPGNENVIALSQHLRRRKIDCLPIRSPTVQAGSERLRIVIHSHNSEEEIDQLFTAIEDFPRR